MNSNQTLKIGKGILAELSKIHNTNCDQSNLVRLEYLFYTDLDLKGEALEEDLEKLNYEVQVDAMHRKCDYTRVFGKTAWLLNDENVIRKWYLEMRDVGNYHECDFSCYRIIERSAIR